MFVGGDRNWKNVVIFATDNFFFIVIYNSLLLVATVYEIFTRARNTSVVWGVWVVLVVPFVSEGSVGFAGSLPAPTAIQIMTTSKIASKL